jgi:hypothetical protein
VYLDAARRSQNVEQECDDDDEKEEEEEARERWRKN